MKRKIELKPCPFCGGDKINMGAFSISPDCYISCECGAMIELEVAWGKKMNEKQHDKKCSKALVKAWNTRTPCKCSEKIDRIKESIDNALDTLNPETKKFALKIKELLGGKV
jgi:hypothetical protein